MSRTFVLGIDCRIYLQTAANRTTEIDNLVNTGDESLPAGVTWTEIKSAQDVTSNLTSSTSDMTNRGSGGWRQIVPALKEASFDFTALWQPDEDVFKELLNSYLSQCPLAYLILDGPSTGLPAQGTNCGQKGEVTGLMADCFVTSFSRNESLEEGLTADATVEPGIGVIYPQWVRIPNQTP